MLLLPAPTTVAAQNTDAAAGLPSGNWLESRAAVDDRPYGDPLLGDGLLAADYFRWKNELWIDKGLSLGGYVSANSQWSSEQGDVHAVGEFLFLAEWELARSEFSARRLVLGLAHDQTFGHPTTREFANEIGLVETPDDLDTESSLSFTTLGLLHWEHEIRHSPNRGWGYRAGQLYSPSYFAIATYLDDDRRYFMARPLAAAAGAQWFGSNDIGLGANVVWWRGPWYLSGSVTDAKANRHYPDFESLSAGRFLYLGEIGFESDPGGPNELTVRATASHLDIHDENGGPGQAAIVSALKRFDDRWAVVARWSKSIGRLSSDYRELLSIGSLWLAPFGRSRDLLGIGAFTGDPADTSLHRESGGEIFYRLQLSQGFSVMPDLQYWRRGQDSGDRMEAWIAGIRFNFDY